MGDFFNFHATFRADNKRDPLAFTIHHHAKIEFLAYRIDVFAQQNTADILPFWPGLISHQLRSQHLLYKSLCFRQLLKHFYAASFTAPTSMYLRFKYRAFTRASNMLPGICQLRNLLDGYLFWTRHPHASQ
ncbi:Uncharacterised protein [Klebsiella pneumoniae]|nr:Uncharacterised protein [Klebsiella pneumoniae]